jgi:hypothetical protein
MHAQDQGQWNAMNFQTAHWKLIYEMVIVSIRRYKEIIQYIIRKRHLWNWKLHIQNCWIGWLPWRIAFNGRNIHKNLKFVNWHNEDKRSFNMHITKVQYSNQPYRECVWAAAGATMCVWSWHCNAYDVLWCLGETNDKTLFE